MAYLPTLFLFFFSCYGDHRDLHSFPTRRSSDLVGVGLRDVRLGLVVVVVRDEELDGALGEEPLQLVLRSEEHTSELQSRQYLVCRLLLEKKKNKKKCKPRQTRLHCTAKRQRTRH